MNEEMVVIGNEESITVENKLINGGNEWKEMN